jgi:hypothetical protein
MTNRYTGPILSRRGLLATGAAAGVSLALGLPAATAYAHDVVTQSEIWGQPTYYEDLNTGTATLHSFDYNSTFYGQLEVWLSQWYPATPSNWVTPIQIWSNGVHVDKPGMHMYGRAMDISRMLVRNSSNGGTITAFLGRYDIWKGYGSSALASTRKLYWATVASLNAHFGVVLTYLYNTDHHNHVHADNSEPKTFNKSTSQVLMVQAVCTYIWGYSTSMDGVWGPQTDTNSRKVLQRIGFSGGLTTSNSNWVNFCNYSLCQGNGTIAL